MDGVSVQLAHHDSAFDGADDDGGEHIPISLRADFASGDATCHCARNPGAPVGHGLLGTLAQRRMRVVGFYSGVEQRASPRSREFFDETAIAHQHGVQAVSRVGFARYLALDVTPGELDGVIERLKREFVFAAEMVVDAALFQPGFLHEVVYRGAKVAITAEETGRPFDDHLVGLFAFAHRCFPLLSDRSVWLQQYTGIEPECQGGCSRSYSHAAPF